MNRKIASLRDRHHLAHSGGFHSFEILAVDLSKNGPPYSPHPAILDDENFPTRTPLTE